MFVAAHGRARGIETAGIVGILVGGLIMVVAFLLRVFSVFTTVSTMGVVLGVAALVVVFAVTSGFEREFQNKVLALNAHLIVQAYGDADFEELADIQRRLAGMPNVVRMAPFLFSPGEVMIGRVGANLKGIDLRDGADDLRRTLVQGSIEDLARPASCPLPATTPRKTSDDVGRVAIGVELARKLRKNVGDCVSIMVPFSSGATDAPVAYQFKIVGLFRMGFNEYDTRIAYVSIADADAAGERAPAGVGRRAALRRSGAGAQRGQGGAAAAGQPASPRRLARVEPEPVSRARVPEGADRAHPGDHHRGRGVQHRRRR